MHLKQLFGLSVISTLLFTVVASAGISEVLEFPDGEYALEIEGSVIRGERDEYEFYGEVGQTLWVSIHAMENNAVFQLYGQVDGLWVPLVGADDSNDTTQWQYELPAGGSGWFKIIVGPTRGSASYRLEIELE